MKTGITAGWAARRVRSACSPTSSLAKSIGGGLPIGAFGGQQEYMDSVSSGKVLHLGTYNGNPFVMAATKAVLAEVCTKEATQDAIDRNRRLPRSRASDHRRAGTPGAHRPVRSEGLHHVGPRADPQLPRLQGHGLRRGLRPMDLGDQPGGAAAPGLDEQWLISVMHDDDDVAHGVEDFRSFVDTLLAWTPRQRVAASGVRAASSQQSGAGEAAQAPAHEHHRDGDQHRLLVARHIRNDRQPRLVGERRHRSHGQQVADRDEEDGRGEEPDAHDPEG